MAAGAWLGGQRSALLMQSSGVGNCVNMLSLIRACRFPMLMLVTMRGEWEEFNPWQVPMGSIVEPTLKLCDTHVAKVEQPEQVVPAVQNARAACVRRRPRRRGAAVAEADRPQGVGEMMFERRAAMATLLANRPKNLFVVPGLGSCTWDAFAAGDDDRNFYLWGAMGGAAMIGLGLALAKPNAARRRHHRRRRDADGARQPRHHRRAAARQPRHRGVRQRPLRRDRHAGEPHQQRRRSARGGARLRHRARDGDRGRGGLAGACRACSRPPTARCSRACAITPDDPPRVLPEKDGVVIKDRVRRAVESASATLWHGRRSRSGVAAPHETRSPLVRA